MSIRTVNKQIRRALQDDKLTACEAQRIVKTAEKGPVTTGEARKIADLYERGEWFMPNTFPPGALPQPRPPEFEMEEGARNTLMNFFVEHRIPQGETYGDVKKDITATLDAINLYDSPLAGAPKHAHNLHRVLIRDSRPLDGDRVDAYIDTNKDEFFVKSTGAGMAGPDTIGPHWYGPFALEAVGTVAPQVAIDSANSSLTKIHNRLTRDLRPEDDMLNFSLRDDGGVAVVMQAHAHWPEARVLQAAEQLLDDAGLPGAELTLIRPAIHVVPRHVLVASANNALRKIHSRLTEELRTEDGISNLSLRDDGTVAVVVRASNRFTDDQILAAAKGLLDDAGFANAPLELVHPQIQPIPAFVMVDNANAALKQIHSRMTADIRSEDDITNLSLRNDGSVAIVVRPHAYYSDADINEAATKLLNDAGLRGVNTEIIRPAVDPIGMWG